MGAQLSLKAELPLAERLATASDRCSKTGLWIVIKRLLVAGYRSWRPTRCPRLTLCIGDVVVSGVNGIFVIGDTASSMMSPGSPYTIVMVGLVGTGSKADRCLHSANSWESRSISHGLGCNPPGREEQPGHLGLDNEQASLHPDSEESHATMHPSFVFV